MLDLHCHILPGLDDGAADTNVSLAMARIAEEAGIQAIVSTPHVREDYPFDVDELPARRQELQSALDAEGINVLIESGAELDLDMASQLDDDVLETLCLGGGRYLLVESPYTHALAWLEEALKGLQERGFRPVLAHPERCPSFISDLDRFGGLVARGILASITAASMTGTFGKPVARCALEMLRGGLVHDVASDAHSAGRRSPVLHVGFEHAERQLPGISAQASWYTEAAPAAMLAGVELPPRPEPPASRRGWGARAASVFSGSR
jgi:protein-tyrosine phosphatase